MKRAFFAILMIACCASVFAQTRKIAILETVDRQKQVSYGVKQMVSNYLAEAITNTPGYEAYDRTDLSKVFDEQEFQRSGYVSDEEIKRIGQMAGVQYILVAEVSKLDEQNLFVTAKILNVETARMEMMANLVTKTDVIAIQQGAKDLASRLLKIEKKVAETPKSVVIEGGYIERVNNNEYKIGGQWVTRKEYYKFINNRDCVPAYQQFQSGKKCAIAGWSTLGAGVLFVFIGGMCFISPNFSGEIAGCLLSPIGAGLALAGIPLVSVGYYRMNNAYKQYNHHCAPNKGMAQMTLKLQSSSNGLGLALNF